MANAPFTPWHSISLTFDEMLLLNDVSLMTMPEEFNEDSFDFNYTFLSCGVLCMEHTTSPLTPFTDVTISEYLKKLQFEPELESGTEDISGQPDDLLREEETLPDEGPQEI